LSNISEYDCTKLLNDRKNDPLIKELVDKVNKFISTGELVKCETQEPINNTNIAKNNREQDTHSLVSLSISVSDRSDASSDDDDVDNDALNSTSSNSSSYDDSDLDCDEKSQMEKKDRFIAQLYKFMDDRDTPLNKMPIIDNKELDLYKLFSLVRKIGGYKKVTKLQKWSYVYKKLALTNSNTINVLNLKNAYKLYLQPYEEFYKKLGSAINDSMLKTSIRVSTDSQRSLHLFKTRVNNKQNNLTKRNNEKPNKISLQSTSVVANLITEDKNTSQQQPQPQQQKEEEESITVASLLDNSYKKQKRNKTTKKPQLEQIKTPTTTNSQKLKLKLKSRINVFEV
jgi:hypothetical protein